MTLFPALSLPLRALMGKCLRSGISLSLLRLPARHFPCRECETFNFIPFHTSAILSRCSDSDPRSRRIMAAFESFASAARDTAAGLHTYGKLSRTAGYTRLHDIPSTRLCVQLYELQMYQRCDLCALRRSRHFGIWLIIFQIRAVSSYHSAY